MGCFWHFKIQMQMYVIGQCVVYGQLKVNEHFQDCCRLFETQIQKFVRMLQLYYHL